MDPGNLRKHRNILEEKNSIALPGCGMMANKNILYGNARRSKILGINTAL